MVYKIGLISTHGTGKTTLAYLVTGELKKRGIKTKPIVEVATEASEQGIPINQGTTLEAQAWILHQQCARELKAEIDGYQVIVCDRAVIDNYIYLANAFSNNRFYRDLVLGHMKQHPYSKLYLLPLVGKLEEDGVRDSQDQGFQKKIDCKLRKMLKKYRIPFEHLLQPESYPDPFREAWLKTIVYRTCSDLETKSSNQ